MQWLINVFEKFAALNGIMLLIDFNQTGGNSSIRVWLEPKLNEMIGAENEVLLAMKMREARREVYSDFNGGDY